MSYVLDEIINQKLKTAFAGLGLDTKYAAAKTSDRPDLSDFQCNGALALAKSEKKIPVRSAKKLPPVCARTKILPGFRLTARGSST